MAGRQFGDAGHGLLDTEELITLQHHAGGLTGNGYAYTIGKGGRAVRAVIDHDIAPAVQDRDAADIEGLWRLLWQRLLFVGRGGMDIEGAGWAVLSQLLDRGLVRSRADFFRLTVDDLLTLDRFARKSAEIRAIEGKGK